MNRRLPDARMTIFDFDGTLCDSTAYWEKVLVDFLLERGVEPPDNCMRLVKAAGMAGGAAIFAERFELPETPERIAEAWRKSMARNYRESVAIRPGAVKLLENLHSRSVTICIATAMERDMVDPVLERCGVTELFDLVLTIEDSPSGQKSPDLFLRCLERFGRAPGETVVFEDSPHAAEICRREGFTVIGVYDGGDDEDFERIRPFCLFTIREFDELPVS